MSEIEVWKKYFEEVFEGAWECYSESSDTPYKQWVRKGARWAINFQEMHINKSEKLKEQLNAYKQAYDILMNELFLMDSENGALFSTEELINNLNKEKKC